MKAKNNLQIIEEQTIQNFPHLPEVLIKKVLHFQWEQGYKQFASPNTASIEFSGLGTFLIRNLKLEKEIEKHEIYIRAYRERLEVFPDSVPLLKKMETATTQLAILQGKLQTYNNNQKNLPNNKKKAQTNG